MSNAIKNRLPYGQLDSLSCQIDNKANAFYSNCEFCLVYLVIEPVFENGD